MRLEAENLVAPHIIKAGHDGQNNDKNADAEQDTQYGNKRHDRHERATWPQVLQCEHQCKRHYALPFRMAAFGLPPRRR